MRDRVIQTNFLENMKILYITIMQNLVGLSGEDPLKEDDEKNREHVRITREPGINWRSELES